MSESIYNNNEFIAENRVEASYGTTLASCGTDFSEAWVKAVKLAAEDVGKDVVIAALCKR